MKKIFTLAIALIATIGVAEAQTYDLYITRTNGEQIKYRVDRIDKITYVERPDENEGWTSLGKGIYGEDFVGTLFGIGGVAASLVCEYEVEIQEKDDQPGLYRLVNPYAEDVYPFFSYCADYDDEENYYIEINACDPDGVYIELQPTGSSWMSYGMIYVYSSAGYYLDRNYPMTYVKDAGFTGTLKDGVITFPTGELLSAFPSYSTSTYYANKNDGFKVVLPGYEDTTKTAKKRNNAVLEEGEAVASIASVAEGMLLK